LAPGDDVIMRRTLALAATVALTLPAAACGDDGGSPKARPAESSATTMAPKTFADAVRAGDLEAMQAAFADEIELYSPVLSDPFVGRDRVVRLFAVLVDTFEDIEVTDEVSSPDRFVLAFTARVEGEPIQVVDLLSFDDEGRIATFVVTARPLAGIQALGAAVAPHLAEIDST
jgi:SnoaL-like domain